MITSASGNVVGEVAGAGGGVEGGVGGTGEGFQVAGTALLVVSAVDCLGVAAYRVSVPISAFVVCMYHLAC
ncbi:MAG: hypothetical protein AAFO91_03070 [Bacteroidota bacterium]